MPFQGPKYNPTLTTKAIAAIVRKDLKAALPTVKTSVRSTSSAITVDVVELPAGVQIYSASYLAKPQFDSPSPTYKYTAEFLRICAVARETLDAYRRDDSDSQRDYFDSNFSATVQPAFDLRNAEWVARTGTV